MIAKDRIRKKDSEIFCHLTVGFIKKVKYRKKFEWATSLYVYHCTCN